MLTTIGHTDRVPLNWPGTNRNAWRIVHGTASTRAAWRGDIADISLGSAKPRQASSSVKAGRSTTIGTIITAGNSEMNNPAAGSPRPTATPTVARDQTTGI